MNDTHELTTDELYGITPEQRASWDAAQQAREQRIADILSADELDWDAAETLGLTTVEEDDLARTFRTLKAHYRQQRQRLLVAKEPPAPAPTTPAILSSNGFEVGDKVTVGTSPVGEIIRFSGMSANVCAVVRFPNGTEWALGYGDMKRLRKAEDA
jgi:hypothetical protein